MISCKDGIFKIDGNALSYWFRVTAFGHLEQLHFGRRLESDADIETLAYKRSCMTGSAVNYSESDPLYCLDNIPLEWSGVGKGDYRHSPMEVKMPDGSFTQDFVYDSHEIILGARPVQGLPSAYGDNAETLIVHMRDSVLSVRLDLVYTLYLDCDVITRSCVLINNAENKLTIRKLMSFMTDIPDRGYELSTFDGSWIKEAHRHTRPIAAGIYVNDSTTGASSNRHNAGFILSQRGASEESGSVYGFNLVYSGNHYGAVELSHTGLVRMMCGINPHCFEWTLGHGESFETPQAVLSYSSDGFSGLSRNMHEFVNNHIVRGEWKDRERPVLLNNWEATFFKFNEGRLLRLARKAKRLGVELFVLDDGWFGERNDDTAGLGDYDVNRRKLPSGLSGLSRHINKMGMMFGLWFEPEMVNPNSKLYRAHPDWAVSIPNRSPALGRNQLVLDLTRSAVRDYIVESVGSVLDSASVAYVKWDMNRHISDFYSAGLVNQGEFFHRYILGLYEILGRIFSVRPSILLESCSSGGNRFDLGMLCYSPQVWCSDDTDPIERLDIQGGLSYLYPQSAMGAHVSLAPHQQTLRNTPLNTRFAVSCFGCLGYELDLDYLNHVELEAVKRQIEWYKQHRRALQYGRFVREYSDDKHIQWTAYSEDECIVGNFLLRVGAADPVEFLRVSGLEGDAVYSVASREQPLFIKGFGALINHILPFRIHPEGLLARLANKYYSMSDAKESYSASGAMLSCGIPLASRFSGSYYNDKTRIIADYGSTLYLIKKLG